MAKGQVWLGMVVLHYELSAYGVKWAVMKGGSSTSTIISQKFHNLVGDVLVNHAADTDRALLRELIESAVRAHPLLRCIVDIESVELVELSLSPGTQTAEATLEGAAATRDAAETIAAVLRTAIAEGGLLRLDPATIAMIVNAAVAAGVQLQPEPAK
jgi:hypothetical protein